VGENLERTENPTMKIDRKRDFGRSNTSGTAGGKKGKVSLLPRQRGRDNWVKNVKKKKRLKGDHPY